MWVVLAYEVKMYMNMRATFGDLATLLILSGFIQRAIAESAVLHARILCDLFSSEGKRYPDDIRFSDLFEDWETGERYTNLKSQVARDEISVQRL